VEILMAVVGALSIYLGYGLFCDSAYQRHRARHLVSGALLAIFGLGILIADVRNLRTAGPESNAIWHKGKSTKEGSFERPRLNKRTTVSERLV
jgi:hypothetical protein